MSNLNMFESKEIFPHTWQVTYSFVEWGKTIAPVYCYLLEGDSYSLIIDTMHGYGNLREFLETLTDKPMKVVNTHFHGDHIGGNYHFDEAYMHWRDFPYFYGGMNGFPTTREGLLERARAAAKPGYAEKLCIDDFKAQEPLRLFPIEDGDIFDIGGRKLQVIWVGGHSPGSIALLDRDNRCAFTGDCCNSNTLLGGIPSCLSVQEYMENLLHLLTFKNEFDIMYGGHQVLPPRVIEEGIELCGRIIAGTDDRYERVMLGRKMVYGARPGKTGLAPDGKLFNIAYEPDNILKKKPGLRLI